MALADTRSGAPAEDGYRIGPDDLLDIRIPDLLEAGPSAAGRSTPAGGELPSVAGVPAFQQGMRVTADGYVKIPSLGLVRASGLTPTELEEDIAKRLVAADLLRHPEVSVQIAEYRSRVVAVTGAVERPGLYPLTRPGARLSDILWAAGGPNREAGRVLSFVPVGESATAPIRVDLHTLPHAGDMARGAIDPPVRPGDVVHIAPAGSVLVDGWVEKPGAYPVTHGLTVSGAVAAAGGRSFAGDGAKVLVKRTVGEGEDRSFVIDLDAVADGVALDVPVLDGDVVQLPVHRTRVVPYAVWSVAKEMIHIGGSIPIF
jgi:polysaccharide export outer membrane protein